MHSTPWQGEISHPGTASLNLCAQVRNQPVYSALHRAYPQELFGFGRQENLKQDRRLFLIYVKVWTDVRPKAGIMSLCVRNPRSLHILLLCPTQTRPYSPKEWSLCFRRKPENKLEKQQRAFTHTCLKTSPQKMPRGTFAHITWSSI